MTYPVLGDFELGKTIFFPFHTFNSSGASVTLTGLATSDILVYKNASMTQRSSTAGFTLVDTDGIDIDTVTGFHGFTIDTSDNTDAGFYAAGNDYTVVVSTVTIDSQTVTFIAGRFSIINRAGSMSLVTNGTLSGTHSSTTMDLGTNAPAKDIGGCVIFVPARQITAYVDSYNTGTGVVTFSPSTSETLTNGDAWYLFAAPKPSTGAPPSVNMTQILGTAVSTPATAGILDVNVKNIDNDAASASGTVTFPNATLASTANITTVAAIGAGGITTSSFATGAINAAAIATDAIGSAELATTAVDEIAAAVLGTAMTEAYATDGSTMTVAQALYLIAQSIGEFSVSGTTVTVKKLDGTTTAATYTLDSSTAPTSRTRAT